MRLTGFCILCTASAVFCQVLRPPSPPEGVDLKRDQALLTWTSHTHTRNTTYTVQYRSREDGVWRGVPGCVNTAEERCDFAAMATELYGAALRVRAQHDNASSPWQQSSKLVRCVHTRVCSPEVELLASPGYLSVQIDRSHSDCSHSDCSHSDCSHSDCSLRDEYGGHLTYRVLSHTAQHNNQVVCVGCGRSVRVEGVSAGERVCVQVQYMIYLQPHGTLSAPLCQTIPQSEWDREVFLASLLVCVFAALVVTTVCCYCLIRRYHTHIKELLTPIHTPDVLQGFSCGAVRPMAAVPLEESVDRISCVEEGEEEGGSTSGSPRGRAHTGGLGSGSGSQWGSGSGSGLGSDWSQSELAVRDDSEGEGGSGYNSGTPLL
ncbi:hypothetical protein ACEWY4_027437 [Coilia grayii]|uniref:Fibronectin type-III domain-containing protein n=1 Tax=Coilia grayii TaxID=363190 RepID=A0ABD1IPR1_9TELE